MKFLIVSFALVAAVFALPAEERNAAVLRQSQDIAPDGNYQYAYETENGISASEAGSPRVEGPEGLAIAVQGQFQYTDDNGNLISVNYVSDENGFQPQGAHLPVAPEIPEAIRRSLEWNAAHPEQE